MYMKCVTQLSRSAVNLERISVSYLKEVIPPYKELLDPIPLSEGAIHGTGDHGHQAFSVGVVDSFGWSFLWELRL